jgi:tripartite-type tricarboxylate transporter receptor subunit TctC
VPYKSNPLAITDLLGGQITMMFTDASTGVTQVKAGKLRALGVTSQRRIPVLPEVPTIDESGVKGYDMGYWFAAYVPAGTPPAVVMRLNGLLQNALASAGVQRFFSTSGGVVFPTTPDALAQFQLDETAKWGKVIKAAGISAE